MSYPQSSMPELHQAVNMLQAGGVVAFPTETVYGLGADASNPEAVNKIYQLKGRPTSHPLIVHIADANLLANWAREIPPAASKLAAAFWPGPLTLVLWRAPQVSDVVTGGQDTVAVRVPSHPIAQQLLRAFGSGVAAPSANRFGHVSPTRAEHVREEFGDEVTIVLEGADCEIGLESTIVSCIESTPRLLRPGAITLSQLRSVVPEVTAAQGVSTPRVSGSLDRHYAPRTRMKLLPKDALEVELTQLLARQARVAVLATSPTARIDPHLSWINAGAKVENYAHDLYANIRTLDKSSAEVMLVEQVPDEEAWVAVRDRLRRAATAE